MSGRRAVNRIAIANKMFHIIYLLQQLSLTWGKHMTPSYGHVLEWCLLHIGFSAKEISMRTSTESHGTDMDQL